MRNLTVCRLFYGNNRKAYVGTRGSRSWLEVVELQTIGKRDSHGETPESDGFCCALQACDDSGFCCAFNHIGFGSYQGFVTSSVYKPYIVIHDIGIYIHVTSEGDIGTRQCIRLYTIKQYTSFAHFRSSQDIHLYLLEVCILYNAIHIYIV